MCAEGMGAPMKALRWFLPIVPLALLFPTPAAASLTTFATFVGNDRGSTDGCRTGSPCLLGPGGPAGASVLGGYLYSVFSGSFSQGGSIAPVDYTRGAYRHGDFASLLNPILDGDGPFNFTITQREDSDNGNGISSGFAHPGLGGGGGFGGGGIGGGGGFGQGDIARDTDGPSLIELKVGDGYSADGSTGYEPIADYWNYEPYLWEGDSIVPSVKAGDANLIVPNTSDTVLTTLAADPPGVTALDDPEPAHAPEPATLSLVLLGGAGLVRSIRRRRAGA